MSHQKELETRKENLHRLFKLATDNPKQAQQKIQKMVVSPYSRSSASDVTDNFINNLTDYTLENYYNDMLYKIWNYAESIK